MAKEARTEPLLLPPISIVGNSCGPAIAGVGAPQPPEKIAQPTCVPEGTGAFTDTSTRVEGGVVPCDVTVIDPYALLLPICPGMIAAVDAPCVCLNAAVQRTGPLSGEDAVDVDADVDPDVDEHAASVTSPMTATVRDRRIDCST